MAFAQLSCNKKEGNDERPVLDELCIGASTEKCTWAIFFIKTQLMSISQNSSYPI